MLPRQIARWTINAVPAALLVLATVVLIYALQARRQADLQPWHTEAPDLEMTAADIAPDFSLAQYIERENALFGETRALLASAIPPEEQIPGNRYWEGSSNNQGKFATDWNRTFERVPAQPRGGALLLHGLTDSPYSLRAIANALFKRGYYVLVLRLPGHGTGRPAPCASRSVPTCPS